MKIADRVKQAATATSDAAYVLGAAEADHLSFFDGYDLPTAAQLAGTLTLTNVPILVEVFTAGELTSWQIITATVTRDGSDVVSIGSGVFRASSTGSALGLTGSEPVVLSVVPSYWSFTHVDFGVITPASNAERYTRRASTGSGGLMALGPRCASNVKHATAQGYNAYANLPYEDAMGCGNWPEAGGGLAMTSRILWKAYTTDATPELLACYDEDGLISGSNQFFLDAVALYVVRGVLTAIETGGAEKKVWDVEFAVFNDGTAAVAAVGTTAFTEFYESAGSTAWTPALVVTDAPDTFSIQVTGEAATNITWAFTGNIHQHIDYN